MSSIEMAANCLKLNPLVSKMKMNPPIWDFSSHSTICPRKQAALMVSLMSISSGFHLSTLNKFIGIVQPFFFNHFAATNVTGFSETLSLAKNSLSLARKSLSLVKKSLSLTEKFLSLGKSD